MSWLPFMSNVLFLYNRRPLNHQPYPSTGTLYNSHAQKYLVAGAQGILLPQCESKKDVERVVEAVKFPPIGLRGLAGERWNAWGMAQSSRGDDSDVDNSNAAQQSKPPPSQQQQQQRSKPVFLSIADCVIESNRNSVVGVLVETRRGLDALEEILSIKELDLVFLAPTDLSSDLGLYGQIRHPTVLQLLEDSVNRIHKYNQEQRITKQGWHAVSVGTLAVSADDYAYWRDRNVTVLCGVAQCMFVDGAKGFMDTVNEYSER
jgi:2-keto-3-deoxy-L-rhamnonate aldolase RhmA